ncbi:MAG: DUF1499 domain-containing protein [Polyangiaceae bacterium]|nr:DUF1499 domain-containing protein [Myxococcales bacterium]MCB9589392.1 DUF1499 domain-containing protein [Polyangiaceae bacterium]
MSFLKETRIKFWLLALGAGALAFVLTQGASRLTPFSVWPIINDVATGETAQYPDIKPQRFNHPPEQVLEAAGGAVRSLPNWKVESQSDGELHAIRTTRLFRFKDDIWVRVSKTDDGWTKVWIRSKSRVGKGDFGQNARNIRELQAALSSRL